jgi:hypothetical protein
MNKVLTVEEDQTPGGKNPSNWDAAARLAIYEIFSYPALPADLAGVEKIREFIDNFINQSGIGSTKTISSEDAAICWKIFGSLAGETAKKLSVFQDPNEELVNQISTILVKKQKDYGSENIARFGRIGLLVRSHDKVARLENLLGQGKNPQNESMVDNFIDVIGYSAIGIMWERGWFMLPLLEE